MRTAPLACLLLVLAVGCSRPPQKSTVAPPSRASRAVDDTVSSVTEMLRQGIDAEGWRNYVQQLNRYLAGDREVKPRYLREAEKELLANHFGLDPSELSEVDSLTFTPLDAHYLDLAFVLRDTIAGLGLDGLEPLDQARKGFDWVMRQVRLEPSDSIAVPPLPVLRRGWGTARERDLVFLALLDQLGIDGCMIALPGDQPGQLRDWVPGALIQKDIYLFDSRLGLPLPGADPKGLATLAQLRNGLDLRQILQVQEKSPYDVSPESARHAEVRVAYNLSSLAPRMEYLQNFLAASEKINLWVDPVARFQRFQAVAGTVGVWNPATDVGNPLRVLRAFLPPEEGGIAKQPFRELVEGQVIPWQDFPKKQLGLLGEPERLLKMQFAIPFVYFSMKPRMTSEMLVDWLPGLSEPSADKRGTRKPPANLLGRPLPRYLTLHGRYEDAASLLVPIHDELKNQKMLPLTPKLEAMVRQWSGRAIAAYSNLFEAEDAAKRGKPAASTSSVPEAKERVNQLWGESAAVMALLHKAAAEPMLDRVDYLLALCKHEQAERLQIRQEQAQRHNKPLSGNDTREIRDAWKSASSWWGSYLDEHGSSPAAPAARRLRAQALQMLGQREAAVALLENLSGISDDPDGQSLEKTARLYLAKQLKTR